MSPTLQLHAKVHGNGHGPWLVFLHGFLGDGGDWDEIVPALAPHFSCLCVDLPGHGASRIEEPCSAVDVLDALAALFDEQHIERCTPIGYSMGGRVALSMAARAPDRVERLILESVSRGISANDERLARQAADASWIALLEQGDRTAFLDRWYAQPLFETLHRDRTRFDELLRRRMQQDPRQLALGLRSMGPGTWPPEWEAWPTIAVPTLLMAGQRDPKYVALAQEMAARNPRARVRIVPDCGHNVHWEDPPAYTAAVTAFLVNE